jgi:drug/metabolite transporter (DMT)-like permease
MTGFSRFKLSQGAGRGQGQAMRGIGLKLVSNLMFAFMAAGVKWCGDRYPVGELIFFRSAFALVPVLYLTWVGGGLMVLRTNNPQAHLVRAISGAISMVCGFTALTLLPLADATVLSFAAPVITTAMAAIALSERVGIYRWSAVAVGFAGVIVATLPHMNLDSGDWRRFMSLGAGLALFGAFTTAWTMISIRRLSATETSLSIAFYFMTITTIGSALSLPFAWITPGWADLAILIGTGLTGGIGQVLMTASYRYAGASVLAPFDYVAIVWALGLGYFLFDQVPEIMVLAGAGIIIAAGLFIIYRERQLGLLEGRKAPVRTAN